MTGEKSFLANNLAATHPDTPSGAQEQPADQGVQRLGFAELRASKRRKIHNRIGAVMAHVPWYGFKSQARLARDLGFSKSAVSRLLRGQCAPSLPLAIAVTTTLEKRLGRPLNIGELFSLDATYPTMSACQLVGCCNCYPPEAYDKEDNLKPQYQNLRPGEWSMSAPQLSSARHGEGK